MPASPVKNAFSVDVEDYYQVLNFQAGIPRSEWGSLPSRVTANTIRILDLLDSHGVKGTFFCLGCVAERDPALIREIAARGHEVASHGYSHTPLTKLSPEALRTELRDSKRCLEDLSGQVVLGFRAPSFSIVSSTQHGLDLLLDEGYRYDSSVFPVRHPDYGIPGAQEAIHDLTTPSGRTITEFPMTVARVWGQKIPVSGGGYFRLLPFLVTKFGLDRVNREGRPAVFYLHPWEVDPDQPDLRKRTSRLKAFRHYTNLRHTAARLDRLLGLFRFAPLREVLRDAGRL